MRMGQALGTPASMSATSGTVHVCNWPDESTVMPWPRHADYTHAT
jgi:hypothetical protein